LLAYANFIEMLEINLKIRLEFNHWLQEENVIATKENKCFKCYKWGKT